MGDWEAARPPSRRGRAVGLAAVVAAVLLGAGFVVLRDARAPAPDLRVEHATDDTPVSTVPTEAAWPRPQPGLWRLMPDIRLTPRVGHVMVWGGQAVFVWGGFDATGLPLNDGALFDTATGTWKLLPPLAGGNATASYAAWSGASVFIVSATATQVFDPDRDIWTTLLPPPLPDGHIVADQVIGTGDGVVVLSRPGRNAEAPRPALFRFAHADPGWRRLPDPPAPMSDGDVVLADAGRVVVHTRASFRQSPAAAELDLRRHDARWRPASVPPGLGNRPLARLLGAVEGDRAVLVGVGVPGAGGYAAVDDGRGWRRADPPPLPASPQVDALWVGDGLIVWDRLTGVGAQLEVRSARWTRFARSPVADGAPRPAAWTGSTIVTWGGFDPAGAVYRVR